MQKFNQEKYLKKLNLKKKLKTYYRYIYLGIPCLLCLIIGIYFAYSKFFISKEEDVIQTKVGDFIYGDIIATPYIDGVYSSTFPEQKTGINVEKIVCDNDATATWDEEKWGLFVKNISKRSKCNIYFVTPNSCGVNDNVICIGTREEFVTLGNEVNSGDSKSGKIIYLTSDLDLGGKFDSDGNALEGNISWTPIGFSGKSFSGTFDGNGHIITNMYINKPQNNAVGLFANAYNGIIKNLGIESSYIKGNYYVASISANYGKIKNVYSKTTVEGNAIISGICAFNCSVINSYNGGNITNSGILDITSGILGTSQGETSVVNSYNYGKISSKSASTGGIAGWETSVYNSYNLGIVTSNNNEWTGGILGAFHNYKSNIYLKNNYNSGTVNGGGIVGCQESGNDLNSIKKNIVQNYFLETTASYGIFQYKSNYNSSPLQKEEMPSVISVINGDNAFLPDTNNINNGYPILKWQAERKNK